MVKKKTTRKIKKKCLKCGSNTIDKGVVMVGRVLASKNIRYKSDIHHPYADHVEQYKALVCLECGHTEIYFDVDELKRKIKKYKQV